MLGLIGAGEIRSFTKTPDDVTVLYENYYDKNKASGC